MTTTGVPLYKLQPGQNKFRGVQVKLNPEPLGQYQEALARFVDCL